MTLPESSESWQVISTRFYPSHDWILSEEKGKRSSVPASLELSWFSFTCASCCGVRREILWGRWATNFGSTLEKSLEKVLTAFRRLGLWLSGFHSKLWLHGSDPFLMMCLIFCHYKYSLLPLKNLLFCLQKRITLTSPTKPQKLNTKKLCNSSYMDNEPWVFCLWIFKIIGFTNIPEWCKSLPLKV